MRVAIVIVVALLLAGCEHVYGAMDAGRFAPLGAPTQAR